MNPLYPNLGQNNNKEQYHHKIDISLSITLIVFVIYLPNDNIPKNKKIYFFVDKMFVGKVSQINQKILLFIHSYK